MSQPLYTFTHLKIENGKCVNSCYAGVLRGYSPAHPLMRDEKPYIPDAFHLTTEEGHHIACLRSKAACEEQAAYHCATIRWTDTQPKFMAGDTVRHGPTGETWYLARDEEDGYVYPGGWPASRAKASDCTIIR